MDMKNVYCLAFHPLVLACLNINNQDYCNILWSWLNLISLLASRMIYCSLILLILILLVTKAPYDIYQIQLSTLSKSIHIIRGIGYGMS